MRLRVTIVAKSHNASACYIPSTCKLSSDHRYHIIWNGKNTDSTSSAERKRFFISPFSGAFLPRRNQTARCLKTQERNHVSKQEVCRYGVVLGTRNVVAKEPLKLCLHLASSLKSFRHARKGASGRPSDKSGPSVSEKLPMSSSERLGRMYCFARCENEQLTLCSTSGRGCLEKFKRGQVQLRVPISTMPV